MLIDQQNQLYVTPFAQQDNKVVFQLTFFLELPIFSPFGQIHRALNVEEKSLDSNFFLKIPTFLSHVMFGYIHRALNVEEKKTNYTVCM